MSILLPLGLLLLVSLMVAYSKDRNAILYWAWALARKFIVTAMAGGVMLFIAFDFQPGAFWAGFVLGGLMSSFWGRLFLIGIVAGVLGSGRRRRRYW